MCNDTNNRTRPTKSTTIHSLDSQHTVLPSIFKKPSTIRINNPDFSGFIEIRVAAAQRARSVLKAPSHFPSIFLNLLSNRRDHTNLSRLLLVLEKNLPWKAMKNGFGARRPQFLVRLDAVTTPAQAVGSPPSKKCNCLSKIMKCLDEKSY